MSIDLATILTGQDPEPSVIVQDMIYQGQMLVVAGDPGVGKSFLQYTLAVSLAADLPFLNHRTVPGKVLYFDEENSRPDLQQYLRWIWRGYGQPSIDDLKANLHIEHFALAQHGNRRYHYMAEIAARIRPAVIIIDTVTPCCSIEDENDNAEASRAMKALRRVKEAAGPDATMILLKHAKFSHDPAERQTIRGAKAWLGEADGIIFHKLVQGKPRADGLRNTRLLPDKVRAFGLRHEVLVTPSWVGQGKERGIVFNQADTA